MLAAREVTQKSMGFSPNYLVFAHRVSGLLAVIHDQWTDAEPSKNVFWVFADQLKKSQKCHVNLLKAYYGRDQETSPPVKLVLLVDSSPPAHSSHPMLAALDDDELKGPDNCVLEGQLNNSETEEFIVLPETFERSSMPRAGGFVV